MENLIVVGCGEHYRANVGPSLAAMEASKELKVAATVDLQPLGEAVPPFGRVVPHVVRLAGQSLASCLNEYREANPVVLLAHSHDWHASDALDLVAGGFRVILEKPYALTPAELALIRSAIRRTPQQLALAEYYLMMKAAPLLHAAGLLRPDAFYLKESGYLQKGDATGPALDGMVGILDRIGRPRMVYVDVLEGEGLTGRFEHRGRQFADMRVGIGVILDLALHALAPLIALEGKLGALPSISSVAVETAVCDTFLRFAESTYGVPPQFVPETYAEIVFTTSLGIPVIMAVGKYLLQNANQRRMLIVGDEGEALLDMSTCTLSLARGDERPSTLMSSPKRPESKYRAVLRASLSLLAGDSPYNFNVSETALRANEVALEAYARACAAGSTRRRYPPGAAPGTILGTPHAPMPERVDESRHEGAKVYYEHQYNRMTSLEDQAFKMSAGVFLLTAAVFTLASRIGGISFLPWYVVTMMSLANLAAIGYVWRTNDSNYVHRRRAKAVLENTWPDMWAIDERLRQRFADRIQMRPAIQILVHLFVVMIAIALLWGAV